MPSVPKNDEGYLTVALSFSPSVNSLKTMECNRTEWLPIVGHDHRESRGSLCASAVEWSEKVPTPCTHGKGHFVVAFCDHKCNILTKYEDECCTSNQVLNYS